MNTLVDNTVVAFFLAKIEGVAIRIWDAIRWTPRRLMRILNHIRDRWYHLQRKPSEWLDLQGHLYWTLELLFFLLDVLAVGEIYETLADIVKFNTRPLTADERILVDEIFNGTINAKRIRIDEVSFLGPSSHHFAYVSFYTINSWGPMSDATFVHELVHVWQYEEMGSVYIPRALKAQLSQDGYDYGGLANLLKAVHNGQGLSQFNLEQQGDILADYHRLRSGHQTRWGLSGEEDLWVYEKLLSDIRKKETNIAA